MTHPKIKSVLAIENHFLVIEFDNNQKKRYDIKPLLEKEMFSPLKNQILFKTVIVEKGGYAVVWNNTIDISEYELWNNGQSIT